MTAREWRLALVVGSVIAIADLMALHWLYPLRDVAQTIAGDAAKRHHEHVVLMRTCQTRRDATNQTQAALLQTQALMAKVLQGLQTQPGGWRDDTTSRLARLEACLCPHDDDGS